MAERHPSLSSNPNVDRYRYMCQGCGSVNIRQNQGGHSKPFYCDNCATTTDKLYDKKKGYLVGRSEVLFGGDS